MKHNRENKNSPEGFENTMLGRIRILGKRGETDTLVAYTDPYYPASVRLAALEAIAELPPEEASRALGVVAGQFGDEVISAALGSAMLRILEKRDVGPLSAAVYLSRQNRTVPAILYLPRLCGVKI